MKLDSNGIPELKDSGFTLSTIFSVLFHVFIFVGIPFFAKYLTTEPKFDIPPTFELMAIPTTEDNQSMEIPTSQQEQPEVTEEPAPQPEPVAVPEEVVNIKKTEKKEEPKKEEPKKPVEKVESKKDLKPQNTTKVKNNSTSKLAKQQAASEINGLFDGPPKKGGSTSSGSASEMSYEGEIARRIEKNWTPSAPDKSLFVIVQYSVARSGSLQFAKKIKGSGNALLDIQAIRAVEMAFPMPPIPSDITNVPLVRTYKLDFLD